MRVVLPPLFSAMALKAFPMLRENTRLLTVPALPAPPPEVALPVLSEAVSHAASESESGGPPAACRDCGTALVGKFCHECGTPVVDELSTKGFLSEGFDELVEYKDYLWATLKGLARPGFLTVEYLAGHRRQYLRPLKLFISVAALHILVESSEQTAGFFRLEKLFDIIPALETAIDAKAGPDDKAYDEIIKNIDERAQTIYSAVQYPSIGLVALVAWLLFRGKKWGFTPHLLFVVHLYCFRYLFVMLLTPLMSLFPPVLALAYLGCAIYMYLAVRLVYQPGKIGGVLKSAALFTTVFLVGGMMTIGSLYSSFRIEMR